MVYFLANFGIFYLTAYTDMRYNFNIAEKMVVKLYVLAISVRMPHLNNSQTV